MERFTAAETICIDVPGDPRGKGRPRFRVGTASIYTDTETRKYEERLKIAAALVMRWRAPLSGPLAVFITARFAVPTSWSTRKRAAALAGETRPTGKPDWDNLAKVTDAFNGIVWRDDALIVEGSVTKLYAQLPALTVTVRSVAFTPARGVS